MPYLQIEIHVLHPSPSAKSRAKAICCRIFTPAQPEGPAASVRDYCSGAYMRSTPGRSRLKARCRKADDHTFVDAAEVTSSVNTLNPDSWQGPKEVTIATSVASRPLAIKIRPMRGLLWRASNVYQRPPR